MHRRSVTHSSLHFEWDVWMYGYRYLPQLAFTGIQLECGNSIEWNLGRIESAYTSCLSSGRNLLEILDTWSLTYVAIQQLMLLSSCYLKTYVVHIMPIFSHKKYHFIIRCMTWQQKWWLLIWSRYRLNPGWTNFFIKQNYQRIYLGWQKPLLNCLRWGHSKASGHNGIIYPVDSQSHPHDIVIQRYQSQILVLGKRETLQVTQMILSQ